MSRHRGRPVSEQFSSHDLHDLLAREFGVARGSRLVVAYSGGLDSHVLLHALSRVAGPAGFSLRAIHVDHGLQRDSAAWARHCREITGALGVPLTVLELQMTPTPGASLEAEARDARYAALAGALCADELCLTAQHADDQAETVLLQLCRGSGPHGLAAMPRLGELGAARLGRPLLGYSREALAAYARRHELSWIDDSSNRDPRFPRNYLRQQLMPLFRARWPGLATALSRSATHAAAAGRLLDELGDRDLAHCLAHDCRDEFGSVAYLRVDLLAGLPADNRRNALRRWLRRHRLPVPGEARLRAVDSDLVLAWRRRQGAVTWDGAAIRRHADYLYLCVPQPAVAASGWSATWDPARSLVIGEGGAVLSAIAVDGGGIGLRHLGNMVLRVDLRHAGACCALADGDGHKPLRKLFQDLLVPTWQRPGLPLIWRGETLIAVAGLWYHPALRAAPGEPGMVFSLQRAPCDD